MSNISLKCNNPLNIKATSDNWRGKVGEYKGFVMFANDIYGYRAAVKILLGYIGFGLLTPRHIISKWAPEPKLVLESYLRTVEKASMGRLHRDEELVTWKEFITLVKCMTLVERGCEANEYDINAGILIALNSLTGYQVKGKYCLGHFMCDIVLDYGTRNFLQKEFKHGS